MKNRGRDEKKKVVICISGMTGSGKSTVAKKLAAKYGLGYFSGGNAFKTLAQEEGCDSDMRGSWETAEGLTFLEQRMGDPAFDRRIDEQLLELAAEGNVVLDSWTMPWLLKEGFTVWLEASPQVRAKRVVNRDSISIEEAVNALPAGMLWALEEVPGYDTMTGTTSLDYFRQAVDLGATNIKFWNFNTGMTDFWTWPTDADRDFDHDGIKQHNTSENSPSKPYDPERGFTGTAFNSLFALFGGFVKDRSGSVRIKGDKEEDEKAK